jgi:hypothetical protein
MNPPLQSWAARWVRLFPPRDDCDAAVEHKAEASSPLKPIVGGLRPAIDITTAEYLQILDWTGRQLAPGKRGRISPHVPGI